MRSLLPVWIALLLLILVTAACGGSAIPSTSPDAVGTIVAATMAAITPASTATSPAATPTLSLPTPLPASTTVPPTRAVILPGTALPGATRITFLDGATTGIVSAPIQAGATQYYVLQASQAQPMLVNVDSLNHDVTLSMKTQGGTTMLNPAAQQTSWEGKLPATEDYYLILKGGATTENFTLTVTIPSRITFLPGATSAKITGKTVAGYNVSYTVFAIKDQKMSVELTNLSGDAALTIYGFADGQPYVRSVTEQTSFSFTLPATQDYIIDVVPRAGAVVNYIMTVKIP